MEKIKVSIPDGIKIGDLLYLHSNSCGQGTIKKSDKENPPNCYAAEDLKGGVIYLNRTSGAVFIRRDGTGNTFG